jgi:hypothetical protein
MSTHRSAPLARPQGDVGERLHREQNTLPDAGFTTPAIDEQQHHFLLILVEEWRGIHAQREAVDLPDGASFAYGSKTECTGLGNELRETLHFSEGDSFAECRDGIVAAAFVVALRIGALIRFGDQSAIEHPLDASV